MQLRLERATNRLTDASRVGLECGTLQNLSWSKEVHVTATFSISPAHTAVMSMDCQPGIVSIYAKDDKDAFLTRAASVLNHARASGMTIIHVQVGFRPGLPEVSCRNILFGAIKSSAQHQKSFQEPLGTIPSVIAPNEGEIVITKHRISAFTGTDLAMVLRANDIDTLVLYGIATSGVVLPLCSKLLTPIFASLSSRIAALTSILRSMIVLLTNSFPLAHLCSQFRNSSKPHN
jgi:hypothetical protein